MAHILDPGAADRGIEGARHGASAACQQDMLCRSSCSSGWHATSILGEVSMKKSLAAAALIAFASFAMAQDAMKITPDALIWKDNPAFPKGIQIATLVGDPTKAGEVVVL